MNIMFSIHTEHTTVRIHLFDDGDSHNVLSIRSKEANGAWCDPDAQGIRMEIGNVSLDGAVEFARVAERFIGVEGIEDYVRKGWGK